MIKVHDIAGQVLAGVAARHMRSDLVAFDYKLTNGHGAEVRPVVRLLRSCGFSRLLLHIRGHSRRTLLLAHKQPLQEKTPTQPKGAGLCKEEDRSTLCSPQVNALRNLRTSSTITSHILLTCFSIKYLILSYIFVD